MALIIVESASVVALYGPWVGSHGAIVIGDQISVGRSSGLRDIGVFRRQSDSGHSVNDDGRLRRNFPREDKNEDGLGFVGTVGLSQDILGPIDHSKTVTQTLRPNRVPPKQNFWQDIEETFFHFNRKRIIIIVNNNILLYEHYFWKYIYV